jgi:hypothetical protein
MNKSTIDMAREVKATAYTNRHYPDRTTYTFGPEQLKAFEALVRADEREIVINEPLTKAQWQRFEDEIRADEREACAKFVEDGYVRQFERPWREDLAAAIRARGNT